MKQHYLITVFLLVHAYIFSQNVGIGTDIPLFRLDVRQGSINTDSVYRIGTTTVLSVSGTRNLFVGKDAGRINNTGTNNTFSGYQSGFSNTIGYSNSFFGRSSGQTNSTGNSNSFYGTFAGINNTTANNNSFFGYSSGFMNRIGFNNSFFGHDAGFNSTGDSNSFFGQAAGFNNTAGNNNSFFGMSAGESNNIGIENSFFGFGAGNANSTGNNNSFFGDDAGYANTTGVNNSFFGDDAGLSNMTGVNNTMVGGNADVATNALNNATAIGANAIVGCSNCLVLGNGANVGIGTTTPGFPLNFADVLGDKISLYGAIGDHYGVGIQNFLMQIYTESDVSDVAFGYGSSNAFNETMRIKGTGNVGIGTNAPGEKLTVSGNICATGTIAVCSDIRYKTNLSPLTHSLDKVLQLKGYYYFLNKDAFPEKNFSDKRQVGFSAQEIETLYPEVVQTDDLGFKSVDYSRLTPILVEAIKEQQIQIDAFLNHDKAQQQEIDQQQKQIDELKDFVMGLALKK